MKTLFKAAGVILWGAWALVISIIGWLIMGLFWLVYGDADEMEGY